MRKVFDFQEFNPSAYSAGPDWKTMLLRYCVMASLVVVPFIYVVANEAFYNVPLLKWILMGVVALYVPALALIRKPSVTVTCVCRSIGI